MERFAAAPFLCLFILKGVYGGGRVARCGENDITCRYRRNLSQSCSHCRNRGQRGPELNIVQLVSQLADFPVYVLIHAGIPFSPYAR